MSRVAVITGASRGFGQALAAELARQMPDIDRFFLIARDTEKLKQTASLLPAGKAECCSIDLSTDEGLDKYRALFAPDDSVVFLANNAGCGYLGDLDGSDCREQVRMVDVNMRALTAVAVLTLPHMAAGAHILNTASIAAFCPNPRMTVYSSSKAYVYAFSRSLGFELKKRGISVTVVCPGPMDTDFLDSGGIRGNSKTFQTLPYCDPQQSARRAVSAALRGKQAYTPRAFYKFYRVVAKIVPMRAMMYLAKT